MTILNSVALNALVAALLAVTVWVAGLVPAVRRRPGLRHFLWVIVLVKLVTPPLVELSILPRWSVAEEPPRTHPRAIPFDDLADLYAVTADDVPLEEPPTVPPASGLDWTVVLALLSGLGTLTILALAVRQIWRLRRALRRGECNDQRLSGIARASAQRMGLAVAPTVCVVSANVSPLLWVRRAGPLVVIPRRLVDRLSDEQLGCVMSHEIAHYVRWDHWTNLLCLLVAALCWWNPVVWWVRRELRTAQEACCDAVVISRSVGTRRTYAETLFQALELMQAERSLLPALASGFGGKSSTRRRFEMIANHRVSHRLSWWSYPVLLAAAALLPCLPTFSQAQEAEEPAVAESSEENVLVPFRFHDGADGTELCFRLKVADAHQTDLRTYKVQRSQRGWVVLAFDKSTKKLAWSSEIELPRRGQTVAGQRFLLHAGGGIVTIAVAEGDNSLGLQELDATSGNVIGQCQLVGRSPDFVPLVDLARMDVIGFDVKVYDPRTRDVPGSGEASAMQLVPFAEVSRLTPFSGTQESIGEPLPGVSDTVKSIDELYVRVAESALLDLKSVPEVYVAGKKEGSEPPEQRSADQDDVLSFWADVCEPPGQGSTPSRPDGERTGKRLGIVIGTTEPIPIFSARRGIRAGAFGLTVNAGGDKVEHLTVEMTGEKWPTASQLAGIWRVVHGDTLLEQIHMSRQDGRLRIVMEGTVKTKKRLVIVTDAADADPGEDAK